MKHKKNNNHNRVALYLHAPHNHDGEEGHSLDRQREDMQHLCHQKGWEIAGIYHDDELSGHLKDRPGLEQLFHDARADKFDTVMVYCVSRLHREIDRFLATLYFFKETNVNFVSYRENIDSTSTWGKLMLNYLATLTEIYINELPEDADQPQPVENATLSKQEVTNDRPNR